jgi:RND family efflux transporter MFP subunit
MKKNLIKILLGLTVVLGIAGCKGNNQALAGENKAISVITEHAKKTEVSNVINVSGNIEGDKTVKLGFMVAGKINKIFVEEGAAVKSGQLISSLDNESYAMAKEIADAGLSQVQDEYNRLSSMHSKSSISESDYSKVVNALRTAKAQQRLQAKNLEDTKLYSPISGIMLKKGVEQGEIIGQGMPVFVVSDIRKVKVSASIPETELNLIKMNNEAEVYISSLEQTFTGKITQIGSLAEPTTRAFTVKIDLKNDKLKIRPGMTSEIRIKTDGKRSVITLPTESVLREQDNSSFVFVADRTKKQAFKRKVTLGQITGDRIEILSGLNVDEEVVTGGQNNLVNGSLIN